jgi:hypothetical protein
VLPVGLELIAPQPAPNLVLEALDLNQLHLTSLFARALPYELTPLQLSLLPATTTRLMLNLSSEAQFQVVPTTLRKLSLYTITTTLSKGSWARLPVLEELVVDSTAIGATEVFSYFPRLSVLNLTISGPSTLSDGKGALAYVSTTLQRLIIGAQEGENKKARELWTDWLLDLPRFTNLSELFLSSDSPLGIPSPPHYLTLLPPSLKTLSTVLDERYVSDAASLGSLPPNLTSVIFEGPYSEQDQDLTLSDDHFASLPRGLSSLTLQGINGISSGLLDSLGDQVTNLELGWLGTEMSEYLTERRAAKWQGFHPSQLPKNAL